MKTRDRVVGLIDLLEQYVKQLETHITVTFRAYSLDLEKKRFAERTLQLAIETCIDICQLIVKELKLGVPRDEESIFFSV